MKFPLSWLKEYVDTELPPQQIAKILTMAGIEVDSIEHAATGFEKVVVGYVLAVAPHPNADKLCVAEVTDGIEKYQVVCGAPNCRPGIKTALALIGASVTLPGGEQLKIKKSKIRAVESFGMLCSGVELGLTQESEGILEFADHLQVGADLAEIYSDTIFEVSLTPNLSHAASLIGIARELSAATGATLKIPVISVNEEQRTTQDLIKVQVDDAIDCPRYTCRVAENIKVIQSPEWLKKRLLACGIRPVHVAVDITNYVLMETGQPLHAFDLDQIDGNQLIVRKAYKNESLQTLDGKNRALTDKMLVIAGSSYPLAIAGVMGGSNSEVKDSTKRFLFESAYFFPTSIRRTSKALALSTDSSKRFERGVDPNGVIAALDRAMMLLQEITQAQVLKTAINIQSHAFNPLEIKCRLARVNAILGTKIGLSELEAIFKRLGFKTKEDELTLLVSVPTFRVDITQEIDLIEEVARIVGYDNIPRRQAIHQSSIIPENPLFHFERDIRRRLIAEGLQEFETCDLIGPSLCSIAPETKLPPEAIIQVRNPTSVEQSILRTSLLQGLLQVVKFNYDRENHDVSGFEVGRVHLKNDGHYQEPSVVGIILTGKNRPHHISPKANEIDFYDLKGIIENLLDGLNLRRYTFRFAHVDTFHSGRQALIQVDGLDVGILGEIHPSIQRSLDVPQRIYFAEINLVDLLKAKRGDLKMRPISLYPSSERDWTLTVQEAMPVQQLMGSIQHIPSKLLEDVSLIDVFRSDQVGRDLKNITLHFVYRDKNKTVSQEEVDAEHTRIISTAKQMLEGST